MADADEASSSIVAAAAAPQRPSSFENAVPQHLLDEAMRVLVERGHRVLAQRVLLFLLQPQFHDAMRLLNEHRGGGGGEADATAALHEFHNRLDDSVHMMLDLDAGYDDDPETFRDFRVLVLIAARETAGFRDYGELLERYSYGNGGGGGGFGTVPAPAAAVAGLEKRTFYAGGNGGGSDGTECSICFEDFVDGGEVSVMPCPSRGHMFHTGCIAMWLGMSNMCPLCRHVLDSSAPAASTMVVAEPEPEPDRVIIGEESMMAQRDGSMTVERRSSTRERRPNVRTSGLEWVRH